MTPAARVPRIGRKTKFLLGVCLFIVVAAALFDWNWLRHPVERFFSAKSHREVRIGDMDIKMGWSLEPTVRLRNVYVENAPWADKRPFAVAGEASFTVSLKSLWKRRPMISRLVLVDADIDLERQADGLRNWRLRYPENRAQGRVRVMRLEAHRSRIRFVRRDIDFEFVAASVPLNQPADSVDATLTNKIAFEGEFQSSKFSGEALAPELLTLRDTEELFPLRGHMVSGDSRLDFDGKVADLVRPSATDAEVRLAGPSLSKLRPLMPLPLPASRRYELQAHFRQTNEEFFLSGLRAKIGSTDLAGEASIDGKTDPPMVKAELRSESADLADLSSLLGRVAPGKPAADRAASDRSRAAGRILPSGSINLGHLSALGAHVSLDARKVKAAKLPALESLRFTAELEKGMLILKPLHIGLADGHVTGWLTLDGEKRPASAQAKLDFEDIRLEQLLTVLLADAPIIPGPVAGHLELHGSGASVAAVLGSASGTLALNMEGGRISNLLDAKLGLNRGKILRLLIAGDRSIEINSADVTFEFEKGTGTSKVITLDTEQTSLVGTGTISLRDETVDLLLTPHPKKPGLFSMRTSGLRIDGTFKHPQIAIVKLGEKTAMATQ
jgi:uncharacterized protein involved in outer membrane biogenesis